MHTLATHMHALPLDIMRILAGGVLFFYFLNALRQAGDFSDPDGLIDHRLCVRLFPPTRISLFQPGMPRWVFRAAYLGACVAAVMVVLGYHPRPAAAYLFAAAVSTYRWNVLAAYLDDSIVHLFCLWLLLLPVGNTLNLPELLSAGAATTAEAWSAAIADWRSETVPGTAPRAFMANMALIYLVAGLYKFLQSHVAQRVRHARRAEDGDRPRAGLLDDPSPDPPAPGDPRRAGPGAAVRPDLRASGALRGEMGARRGRRRLPPGHHRDSQDPVLERAHVGRASASSGPRDHAGRIAARRPRVHGRYRARQCASRCRRSRPGRPPGDHEHLAGGEGLAQAPQTGQPYSSTGWANPVRALLWLAGIFQSYRLFDWVDARNYHVRYEVWKLSSPRTEPVEPRELFPESMRHLLLQSYFLDNIWLQMEGEKRAAVRRSLLERHARRFARAHPDAGEIEAVAVVQRITPDNLELTRGQELPLMRFTCAGGRAVVRFPGDPDDPDLPA